MQSLQSYADTTDSDSESYSEYDADSNRAKDISGTGSNFFGIESDTSRPFSNKANFKDEQKFEHKSENEDSNSDVPDSDFWKGFVPDLTKTELCGNMNNRKKDIDGANGTSHCVVSKIDNTRKRPHSYNYSSNADGKRTCSSLRQDSKYQSSTISTAHSRSDSMPLEKRKMYYVHSKVAPYLTSKSTCKCASKSVASWRSHDQAVNRLMWNRPNFSHLLLTAGMDSLVKVWNVWSTLDRSVFTITHHSKAVRNALWGVQGRKIVSCSYDKTAIVTDVESGAIQSRYPHPGFVMACTLHPVDPNCFVTGCENLIQFWDQRTPMSPVKVLTFKDKMGQPQDLLFIQGGNELISCSDIASRDSADRTIMAWDVKSGKVISNQIYQERYTCTRLKQGPSNSRFFAQTQGGYVASFSTTRPYKIDKNKRFEGHEMQGYNIGFDMSYDGSLLYSGSSQGGVHCYDYRSGRLIKKCTDGNNNVITDVACHPVLSTLIATCSWGGSVALWQ